MSISYNYKYDYIIYGGSISSIIAAIHYKQNGNSVLLLNKYGFLGGGITECLNLVQNIDLGTKLPIIAQTIIDNLGNSNFVNIANSSYLVNPEMLKFVLQDLVLEHKIDLLYHVVPISINTNSIILMGKEGKIELSANSILDYSDNKVLSYLTNSKQSLIGIYNIVVKAKSINELYNIFPSSEIISISNNRFLIETIINFDNLTEVEINAHNLINEVTHKLVKEGNRIELLPAETFLFNNKEQKHFNRNLFTNGIELEKSLSK